MNVLLLLAFASAGMCFPSTCLTMGIHVAIFQRSLVLVKYGVNSLKRPHFSLYNPSSRTTQETSLPIVKVCLLIRCLSMDVLFVRLYASAGMCLPSRCLATGLYVIISSINLLGTPQPDHWAILRLYMKMQEKYITHSCAGAGFIRELQFPLPIYIPSALHNHLHYHPRLKQ
jgi:hypothetical protein